MLNFLNSGKNWYGESLSAAPGYGVARNFAVPFSNAVAGAPATLVSSCVARSIGGGSRFTVSAGGATVLQHDIAATGNTQFDVFAGSSQVAASFMPTTPGNISYNFTPAPPDTGG